MLKVLMIMTTPFSQYGIGTVVKNYSILLKKEVHFDYLICRGIDKRNEKFVKDINGNVWRLLADRERQPLSYVKELIGFLKKHRYDVIHIHGNSGTMALDALAARLSGSNRIIAHCHSNYTDYPFLHKVMRPLLNICMSKGLACSDEAGKWCFYKYEVLNNAIDSKRFAFSMETRELMRKKYKIKADDFVLLSIGHLDKGKNHSYIISMLPKLIKTGTPVKLFIVGDGVLKGNLINLINDLGVEKNVVLPGSTQYVENYYSMADFFLFPSLFEGLGLVLIEAQASGLNCIASKNVPQLGNICNGVKYLDLKDEINWIKTIKNEIESYDIENRSKKSITNCEIIHSKGYDLEKITELLFRIYNQ